MFKNKEDKKYIELFLRRCRENVDFINSKKMSGSNMKTVFTVGCTKNYKNRSLPYTTPSRFNKYFCITGCIVFSKQQAMSIVKILDGLVDIIAIDTEKKIPESAKENGNLMSACFNYIKKSKAIEFKANDLTVDAVWAFISNKLKILDGKKIAVVGAGNIGSKLALKFVESGCEVSMNRRDHSKGRIICKALNLIKPELTTTRIYYDSNVSKSCFKADAILGCTNGVPVIEWEHIHLSNKNSIVVDVGKGSISKDAIKIAGREGRDVYRTDISAALDAHLIMFLRNDEIINTILGRRTIGGLNLVSGGMYGRKGDIVVDNVNYPKAVFGIADGEGDFVRKLGKEERSLLNKVKDKICKDR